MDDLISRQAAIDAIARMMPRSYTPDGSHPADEEIFRAQEVFADCIEALEILPSAQPATSCSEIPNGSDDTISRQAAIDCVTYDVEHTIECLKALSSAQPEPKNGKWIEDAKTYYEQLNERGLGVDEYTPYFTDDIACSVCLAKYSTIDNETQFFKFCPNCGADMRKENES